MSKRRNPLRIVKSFDRYEIKTGHAGFVKLIKNGKRIMPRSQWIVFNKRHVRKQP